MLSRVWDDFIQPQVNISRLFFDLMAKHMIGLSWAEPSLHF
jgi:hypothetical protein